MIPLVREIVRDVIFLSRKSEPADRGDADVMVDLKDTLAAHRDGSVGMARGDGDWPVTFEGEVFNALVAGTTARIEFWCEAGSYIWEYEYVVPEA